MPAIATEIRETASAKMAVWLKIGLFALLAVAVLGGAGYWVWQRSSSVSMTTQYQAVLLTNGSAYFGHLEGLGTPYPVLRDVFYVQSMQDPQTKAVSNVLVKRGKEWHGPDRMILNANMIVFVEPVSPSSRVAALITQAKNQ
jgi:hypothetical protein